MKEQIKPQGDRFNEGKIQWRYLHPKVLEGMAKVFMNSTKSGKYEPFNYTKGLSQTEIMESLKRHWDEYLIGKEDDHDSGLPLTWHILANAYLLEFNRLFHPEYDDRFFKTFQKAKNRTIEKSLEELKKYHYPEQQTEPTFLDMDCAKHRINNRFYKLIDELLERHVSNGEKKLEIGKLLKMRDNSMLELDKLRTKSNSGPREISKSKLEDMAKDCNSNHENTLLQSHLYQKIKKELNQFFEMLRCGDTSKSPVNLVDTASDMYFESLSYLNMQKTIRDRIIESRQKQEDITLFEEKKEASKIYLKNRLGNILLDFHDKNNFISNFSYYKEKFIGHIFSYILNM